MARIRTIKPSFFESEDVAVLPLRARLLWIGLWTHCDDEGRTKDHSKLIKARIWPLDPVTLKDIEEDLETLDAYGRIVRYEVDGQRYLEITNWRDHQSINKPTPSKFPPPPKGARGSRRTPVALPEDSLQEGKGREGKGRDACAREPEPSPTEPPEQPPPPKPREATPPPDRCAQHLDDPDPPNCGPCASARKARERWDTDQAAEAEHQRKQAALAQSTRARQRAEAERAAIDNCHWCDDTGKRGAYPCNHTDPALIRQRASRGAALARERAPAVDAARQPPKPNPLDAALAELTPSTPESP